MKNIKAILLGITIISASIYSAEVSDKEILNNQLIEAAKSGDLVALKKAHKNGAELTAMDAEHGSMAIHWAAYNGHTEIVEYLLKFVDNGIQNRSKYTPLHFAAQENRVGTLNLLLKADASIEKSNQEAITPLELAAFKGHVDVIKKLVKLAAIVDPHNILSAINHAVDYSHVEVLALLIGNCPLGLFLKTKVRNLLKIKGEFSELLLLIIKDNSNLLKEKLSQEVKNDLLNFQDITGTTSLMYAISKQQNENIKILLDYDRKFGQLNFFTINKMNQSVLSLALDNNCDAVISRITRDIKTANNLEIVLFEFGKFSMPIINLINQYLIEYYNRDIKNKYIEMLGLQ